MSTCVQVFFYSVFPMVTKETLKTCFKSVATEISFRWLGKAVSQVIDATIYIKVHKNAKRFMATLICHKTRISLISSVGHAKGSLAMQYSWSISLYQHKSRWNKYKASRLRPGADLWFLYLSETRCVRIFRAVRGHPPRKIFEVWVSEMAFPAFW